MQGASQKHQLWYRMTTSKKVLQRDHHMPCNMLQEKLQERAGTKRPIYCKRKLGQSNQANEVEVSVVQAQAQHEKHKHN